MARSIAVEDAVEDAASIAFLFCACFARALDTLAWAGQDPPLDAHRPCFPGNP